MPRIYDTYRQNQVYPKGRERAKKNSPTPLVYPSLTPHARPSGGRDAGSKQLLCRRSGRRRRILLIARNLFPLHGNNAKSRSIRIDRLEKAFPWQSQGGSRQVRGPQPRCSVSAPCGFSLHLTSPYRSVFPLLFAAT